MAELSLSDIEGVFDHGECAFVVTVLNTQGSTPRGSGALMLVSADKIFGTIGGGSAEWLVVQNARKFIAGAASITRETITLGPQIDQCCGGTLDVSYQLLTADVVEQCRQLFANRKTIDVLIFGAGNTGIALANALQPLGFSIQIIDPRQDYCARILHHRTRCLALPEMALRSAPANSVFVITTHDHSLDFLITAEALKRADALYVGMIGSRTKRAVLKNWMGHNGYDPGLITSLFCPIGGTNVANKQPEFIAAMSVAEILVAIEKYRDTASMASYSDLTDQN